MTGICSKAEFARRHRVTAGCVTNWLRRGYITPPALRPDGRIEITLADGQLASRLNLGRSVIRAPGSLFAQGGVSAVAIGAEEADQLIRGELDRRRRARVEVLEIDLSRGRLEALIAAGKLAPLDALARETNATIHTLIAAVEAQFADWSLWARSDARDATKRIRTKLATVFGGGQ